MSFFALVALGLADALDVDLRSYTTTTMSKRVRGDEGVGREDEC